LIFRVLQNSHLIHTTPRVASVTVSLKPVLTADRIHVNNLEKGFVEYLADQAIDAMIYNVKYTIYSPLMPFSILMICLKTPCSKLL
jgi:hypothetical protein